jgi:tripartite-type tricarboxylate transporter receptor subunit TctC
MNQISGLMLGLLALLIVGSPAAQATYPEKPIHLVVGFPPGSSPDIVARVLGQKLAEALGKPVLVENIPGASGTIATERVAKASPDGYTLAFASSGFAVNPSLYANLAFDSVRDFAPISQVVMSSNILVVNNAVPAKSVQELLALAKAQPGGLTFASGGSGSTSGLAGALFKSMARIDVREVPYKGVIAAIPDLLGGRITMMFIPIASGLPLVREGRLRALAVTSLRRSAAAPELPTLDESGVRGFEVTTWGGMLAPAGTPSAVIERLRNEIIKALRTPEVRERLSSQGNEPVGSTSEQFSALIKIELVKWARVIKESGIKPD